MPAYVTLPGTSGNYFSTPDVNLLDADTAHMHQSFGGVDSGAAAFDGFVQDATLTPIIGDYHGKFLVTGTPASGVFYLASYANRHAVSASTQYTLSYYIAGAQAATSPTVAPLVVFYDGAGAFISSDAASAVAITSTLTQVSHTFTTPVGTATVLVGGTVAATGNLVDDDPIYVEAACLRAGSDGTFVPSLRIVGDLDIEAKVALTDWTPAADSQIVGASSGGSSYLFGVDTLGYLKFTVGGIAGYDSTAATGVTDGDSAVVQMQFDDSANTCTFYLDGVQLGTPKTVPFSLSMPTGQGLGVGANSLGGNLLAGDVYYVIVRDGIDGPIVAKFDADDWVGI